MPTTVADQSTSITHEKEEDVDEEKIFERVHRAATAITSWRAILRHSVVVTGTESLRHSALQVLFHRLYSATDSFEGSPLTLNGS